MLLWALSRSLLLPQDPAWLCLVAVAVFHSCCTLCVLFNLPQGGRGPSALAVHLGEARGGRLVNQGQRDSVAQQGGAALSTQGLDSPGGLTRAGLCQQLAGGVRTGRP